MGEKANKLCLELLPIFSVKTPRILLGVSSQFGRHGRQENVRVMEKSYKASNFLRKNLPDMYLLTRLGVEERKKNTKTENGRFAQSTQHTLSHPVNKGLGSKPYMHGLNPTLSGIQYC